MSTAKQLTLATVGLVFLCSIAAAEIVSYEDDSGLWQSGCEGLLCHVLLPIEITAEPNDIFDGISGCTNSEICLGVIAAGVAAAGGDPSVVGEVALTYNTIYEAARTEVDGNQHWLYFPAPSGSKVCSIKWHIWSITTESSISATFREDLEEVVFYANVPVDSTFGEREFVKGLFQLSFIEGDAFCPPPPGREETSYGFVMVNTNDPSRPVAKALNGDVALERSQ